MTMMEVFLATAIAILASFMVWQIIAKNVDPAADRDLKRLSDMAMLRKALIVYIEDVRSFPTYTGCITGSDPMTKALNERKAFVGAIKDPKWPDQPPKGSPDSKMTGCYYYEGGAGQFKLMYFTETNSSSGGTGKQVITP